MSTDFLVFAAIGFVAQLVDGALGLAFGLIATSSLLAFGVAPVTASAMTHVAEMFTTAASGASHAWHRNVDWRLVLRLAPAGMAGGILGAILLASVDGDAIAPFVSAYLIAMGLYVLVRAFRPGLGRMARDRTVPFVGLAGGALDAIGGGGWGPIVTSTLLGRGHEARKVIGSTNLTEFAVTVVISVTFVLALGWSELQSAAGLVLGGVLAAPIGGFVLSRVPQRPLLVAVALVIIAAAAVRLA